MLIIKKFNHYFTVTESNFSRLVYDIKEFTDMLVTHTLGKTKGRNGRPGKTISVVDKKLYIIEYRDSSIPKSKNQIRFPINVFDDFIQYLEYKGINETNIKKYKSYKPSKLDFVFNPNKTHRDYQIIYVDKLISWTNNSVLVDLQTGRGKSIRSTSPVRTTNGWIPIGELKVNHIIIGRDGKPTKVTGVYPQGELQLYKVTFTDGRSVDACLEHLWTVYLNNCDKGITLNTKAIMEKIDTDKLYIDLVTPEDNGKDLRVPMNATIWGSIPIEYLNASKKTRTHLLNVLMFTNISKENNPCVSIVPFNKMISADMIELARSLGYVALESRGIISVFINSLNTNKLGILSIEKADVAEATCITVDNDDKLFVVKDYIVTHNTMISISALADIGRTFVVMILPRFIDKWVADLLEDTDMVRDDILVIKGVTTLIDILKNPDSLSTYKCFIISMTTVNLFMTSFMKGTDVALANLSPEDIMPTLKADTLLIDEVHKEFYTTFKFLLYSNHRLTLGLSATLLTNQNDVEYMYQSVFPDKNRISNIIPLARYITAYAIQFRFNNPKRVKVGGAFGYSSEKFEKYIMNNSVVMDNYFRMITTALETLFIRSYKPGDKSIIFMYTTAMCSLYRDYLIRKFKKFKVTRYTEKEDYSVLLEHDIIVSTIPSAGTAIDLPGLTTGILTVNTNSLADNVQILGRLRELKDREVKFAYFFSGDISQHVTYHNTKKKLFKPRTKSLVDIKYNNKI